MPTDEVWYKYNTNNNNIKNIKVELNLVNTNIKEEYTGKIISKHNMTIAPKTKIKVDVSIKGAKIKIVYKLQPVKRLSNQKYIIIESQTVDNNNSQVFV